MWHKRDFVSQKPNFIKHMKKKGFSVNNLGEYCTLTGIPLIVAYDWVIEEMPRYTKICSMKIESLMGFYGIGGDNEI